MSTGNSAEKGKQSTQYMCIQKKYGHLTGYLRINKDSKRILFGKFVAEGWHGPDDCPGENALINIALKRIEHNPSEFEVFIKMLEENTGMDNIVKDLKGTSYKSLY